MRIFLAQLNPLVGDIKGNTRKIISSIQEAKRAKADIVLFSEMILCGYPPEDLLLFPTFISEMEKALLEIAKETSGIMAVVGYARKNPKGKEKPLCNSAAVFIDGKVVGHKDKTLLPTYDVFDERRYFVPGEEQKIWEYKGCKVGVLICEDAWQHSGLLQETKYERDPVLELQKLSPDIVLNLSASPYFYQKNEIRKAVFQKAAKTLHCPWFICNQVGGNDQLVFDGYSLYINGEGEILHMCEGFSEDSVCIDLEKQNRPLSKEAEPIEDLFRALVLGVRDYFTKQGLKKGCIGLSGGIDSSLTACIAKEALGSENLLCLSMPSRYSSLSSIEDAIILADRLQISLKEIPIDLIFQDYLDLLSPLFYGKGFDTTEENLQARIRGMILMAIANKLGYVVLSTGNKSEMAMGYCTLYGDMCGGLGVLNDVSKKQVYELSLFINRHQEIIPKSVLDKPPSAELRPNQKDSDSLPEYSIVDKVLEDYVENHLSMDVIIEKHHLSKNVVEDLISKIHRAEYKRRQAPPGIRVTKRSFSKGRFLPIVQGWVE